MTGASGFCGGHVVRRFAGDGHDVVCLGRSRGPVGEQRRWDAAAHGPDLSGVDAVVHLAAAVGDPRPGTGDAEFDRVNVDGARRLLEAVGDRPVVWVSSSSVYDTRVDRSLVAESHPTLSGQLNAYGRSKSAGDRLALSAGAIVLRPRAVYGPGDTHLLPRLVRAVRGGTVNVPGDDVRISLTHVANLADACVEALAWPAGAYNVADAAPVSRDVVLAEVLTAALGRPVGIRHLPVVLARLVADVASAGARVVRREPLLTRYAVDQLSHDFVLDLSRSRATGWEPRDLLAAYVAGLRGAPSGRGA